MRCLVFIIAGAGATVGCTSDAAKPPKEKPPETPPKLAGVYPEKFECSSILSTAQLTDLLAAPTRTLDSASSVTRGTPRPCNYESTSSTGVEHWTFDFDCRDGYKQRADALFAQYKQQTADRMEQYNQLSDAGVKSLPRDPNNKDAGVIELKQPGVASDVEVGAKALDHNDQGILFIDDDAPCYVRVIGPDPARRLALAKAVAKHLTFANAPMTPRPLK
jgi:hypothetical protein